MNYKQGKYTQKELNKRTYKRKRNYNKTYKGGKTLRTKNTEKSFEKFLIIGTVFAYLFVGTYSFATDTRTITVQGGGAMVSEVQAVKQATPQLAGDDLLSPVGEVELPVREFTEKEYILYEVERAGLNPAIAEKIIFCESRFQEDSSNTNKDGSIDRGIWMINDKWHSEVSSKCCYDYKCATEAAIKIAKKRGWGEWTCGKKLGY